MTINICSEKKTNKIIEDLIKSFMHEYFGKGPSLIKVTKVDNNINILCRDIMTKLEKNLAMDDEGCRYVRAIRRKIFDSYNKILINRFEEATNIKIKKSSIKLDAVNNNLHCLIIIE